MKCPTIIKFILIRGLHSLKPTHPPFIYTPLYSCEWPETHRFPMQKFRELHKEIVSSGIYSLDFLEPPLPFGRADYMKSVYNVHDKDYINRLLSYKLKYEEIRKIGLEFNEYLVERTFSEV